MELVKNAFVTNYRLLEVQRIDQLGRNKDGEITKIKTAKGNPEKAEIWPIADLHPQGSIVAPLTQEEIDSILLTLRELSLSGHYSPEQAKDGLALVGALTQEQKGQLWAVLSGAEKKQLQELGK